MKSIRCPNCNSYAFFLKVYFLFISHGLCNKCGMKLQVASWRSNVIAGLYSGGILPGIWILLIAPIVYKCLTVVFFLVLPLFNKVELVSTTKLE